jgi:hypothetical protein
MTFLLMIMILIFGAAKTFLRDQEQDQEHEQEETGVGPRSTKATTRSCLPVKGPLLQRFWVEESGS